VVLGTPGLERLPLVNGGRTCDEGQEPCHLQGNSKPADVPIRSGGIGPTSKRPGAFHSPSLSSLGETLNEEDPNLAHQTNSPALR
jgi:hypothetical protein